MLYLAFQPADWDYLRAALGAGWRQRSWEPLAALALPTRQADFAARHHLATDAWVTPQVLAQPFEVDFWPNVVGEAFLVWASSVPALRPDADLLAHLWPGCPALMGPQWVDLGPVRYRPAYAGLWWPAESQAVAEALTAAPWQTWTPQRLLGYAPVPPAEYAEELALAQGQLEALAEWWAEVAGQVVMVENAP
jgi:hypothetical protein